MKKLLFWLLLCLPLCLPPHAAARENALTLTAPEAVRPYENASIAVDAPEAGLLTLTVSDDYLSYEIARMEVAAGSVEIPWNGLAANGEALRRGDYTLRASLNGAVCETGIRALLPAVALQYCIPSHDTVYLGREGFLINYLVTGEGLMYIRLSPADAPDVNLKTWSLEQHDSLPHLFHWNGQVEGRPVSPGAYTLTFWIKNSPQPPVRLSVRVAEGAPAVPPVAAGDAALFLPEKEEDAWACLMAPVTVVDIGLMQHQNIYAQPTQKSTVLGTLHGQSHGVLVLETGGEFVRIGTWRQEDGEYVEGYVPASRLKNVLPNPHYGLIVDKKTQKLQVWQDGEMLGELAVSTGLMAKDKLFRETPAGAFLTTDRMINFKDSGYQYNYALRIDGGNLIHSLGCYLDGSKFNYNEQLAQIGQKASHGCVRVDPRADAESGLNVYWLWTHIPYNTKVLVLDDPEARAARKAELLPTQPPTQTPAPTAAPTPTAAAVQAGSPAPTDTPAPTDVPVPTATPAPAYEGLLSQGCRGVRVLQLQERLGTLGYYAGELDGSFGRQTDEALKAFQRVNGLGADGILGPKSFAVLWSGDARPAPVPSPVILTAAPTQTPRPTEAPAATVRQTAAPAASPTPTPEPPAETTLVISLAGDTLLGSEDSVRRRADSFDSVVAAQGCGYPLRNFAALFASDDITFLNLECVLKDNSRDKTEGRLYNFRGPTAFAQILAQASVEHVNLANNHYIDFGDSGRRETRAALTAAGVTYSGYTWTQVYEKDGVKIGFAGIRETRWKQARTLPAQEIKALRAAGCDYIVYACHFGNEYEEGHNELQTEMAHSIIDAGADCIVGTHPHVVQGIESYRGRPIFYSLGNFVFGGNLNPTDYDGLAAQMTLHFTRRVCDGVSVRLIPLMTSGVQDGTTDFCPVIAEGADKARILERVGRDSTVDVGDTITFIPDGNGK